MTLKHKQETIESNFASCRSQEEIYQKIMEWGKNLPTFDEKWRTEENRVTGCQSLMYLHAEVSDNKMLFSADSDALISKGLAALLVFFYNEESPETILKEPPTFLESIVLNALTPGRANGFSSLYLRMKQAALKALMKKPQD
jgi:cysteine desulfuration protein SufE